MKCIVGGNIMIFVIFCNISSAVSFLCKQNGLLTEICPNCSELNGESNSNKFRLKPRPNK